MVKQWSMRERSLACAKRSPLNGALESWENAVTLTTAEDIGCLTAQVLTAESPILNQVVFVAGDTVTYGQAADLVEEVNGTPVKREVWSVTHLRAQLANNPQNGMAKYHIVFVEGLGVSWSKDLSYNEQHRIPVTGLRQWLIARRTRLATVASSL